MNTLKSEFFLAALVSTIAFILVGLVPWIWSGETNAFHRFALFIVVSLWVIYLVLAAKERYGFVLVVIENIESVLLEELLSNSGINATMKNVRHLSNLENWEIEMTQKDYEKISEYMSKYNKRYRGRIYKIEE